MAGEMNLMMRESKGRSHLLHPTDVIVRAEEKSQALGAKTNSSD